MNIVENCKYLKLPYVSKNYQEAVIEAKQTKKGYDVFLNDLLDEEALARQDRRVQKLIKSARFPQKKYLEDFSRDGYGKSLTDEFAILDNLTFIDRKENVILIGTPGSGKTHYAIGLGMRACLRGKTVLFTSVPNLVIELREALTQNTLNAYKRKFEQYDLVILDELGYVSFDKAACEVLFNLLSNRTNKGAIIITTNLSFDRWEEIFKDPMLTGAIVDRLAYKAHVLDMTCDTSHRFTETAEWRNEQMKLLDEPEKMAANSSQD